MRSDSSITLEDIAQAVTSLAADVSSIRATMATKSDLVQLESRLESKFDLKLDAMKQKFRQDLTHGLQTTESNLEKLIMTEVAGLADSITSLTDMVAVEFNSVKARLHRLETSHTI